ncbi:MAG: hypothetical protein AAGH79_13690 [Bacteroidota bacterium]
MEVKATAFARTAESPISIQAFSVNEIERMPGATLDLSKFVKTLPGVAPRVSFGYNQIVRGGLLRKTDSTWTVSKYRPSLISPYKEQVEVQTAFSIPECCGKRSCTAEPFPLVDPML